MKTIKLTAFSILFALLVLVSACKKETTPEAATQTGSKILVTGQDAGTGLKSTLSGQSTVWVATSDKVGIYSDKARTETGLGGSVIVNAPFTAATSAASSAFSGTMFWGAASTSHTFYAYYPYTAGSAASTVVPVSLATAQTQSGAGSSAHIGALDFMIATPAVVTSPANTNAVANEVNLRYNHLFTILEFQIKGSGALKAVKFSGSNTLAFSGGTIDITQATPATDVAYAISTTGTTTQAVVTLTDPATLNASTAATVYMVINPGTQTGNCTIGLSSDGTTWTDISKAAPTGGFLRGNKYVVIIGIDQNGNYFSTVTNPTTGKTWMDRNLGASRVAISSIDENAYGDLYQWGRGTDGHQIRTSVTTGTLSSSDAPGHANFITNNSAGSNYDWRNPQNVNLWQGLTGINNPCPSGFRLPTEAEFNAEKATWSAQTSAGAFGSPLKLPVAGYRYSGDGLLYYLYGYYWSSAVDGFYSRSLSFYNSGANMYSNERASGFSVRCVKD
ncbi:MAG: fimbrillin family protein [Prolixibacteraceae bacterium]